MVQLHEEEKHEFPMDDHLDEMDENEVLSFCFLPKMKIPS